MTENEQSMAQQIAKVANDFQQKRTGHAARSVKVALGRDMVVVTLHDALTPAEQEMAKSPAGVAQVQEFHRQLFASNAKSLREEIQRIIGVEVREAAAEIEMEAGAVVHAFTTGTMVQVFLMAENVFSADWYETGKGDVPTP